jgi:hypothetical protein
MRKFKYTLLIAVGFLIFTATQYASSPQDRQMGQKAGRQWGSGPAAAPTGTQGIQPEPGSCGFTTLRFDELPFQPVNGLQFRGVQFFFTVGGVASTDAFYNAAGPGIQTFVQDPVLEGDAAGQLVLDFPALTPSLSFGIARNTFAPLTPGATVTLFNAMGGVIGVFPVNLAPTFPGGFSEGLFTYNGPTLVRRAVIIFNSPGVAPRFALDNLTYRAFPIILQDDTNTNLVLQINPLTGDYEFINCSTGLTVFGRGGATNFGCILAFGSGGGNKGGPAQVSAQINTCANTGAATIRLNNGTTFNIADSDITNNTCCQDGGENRKAGVSKK